jgi:hypothetical protein
METINKLIDILYEFFNKYFIPTLISLLLTIIVKYLTPYDNVIFIKLGEPLYLTGIFIFLFLLINLIIYLYLMIRNSIKYQKENKLKKDKELANKIAKMQSYIDRLTPHSKEMINYFLESNNESLVFYETFNRYIEIYNSDDFIRNLNSTQYEVKSNEETFTDLENFKKTSFSSGTIITKYKLKNTDYEILKYMKDNNIKLSNFN